MPRDRGVTSSSRQSLDVAAENAGLNGRAHGDAFVRVDALEGILAGDLLDGFLHGGDAGGAADQQDLGSSCEGRSGRHPTGPGVTGPMVCFDQIRWSAHRIWPGSGSFQDAWGRVASAVIKGRLISVVVMPDSSILAFSAASLSAAWPSCRLSGRCRVPCWKLGNHPIHDPLVKIVAAQAVVAGRGQDLHARRRRCP